jgi:TPP-dependent pyruvate/acetoin dehydrogenase alpha subunit
MRLERAEAEPDIHKKAACYRIPSEVVDGMDVVAVEAAARRALEAVRAGDGPYFLECRTYRFRPHSMFDAQLYRHKTEVEAWRAKGPIVRFQGWLLQNKLVHTKDIETIEAQVRAEIDEAVAFAEAGDWEPVESLTAHVYAPGAGQ